MNPETQKRWYEVCDREEKRGYVSLAQEEKLWLNIRSLIDSIENGGLISYFYNSYADTIQDCLCNLQVIGAKDVKTQVERVCALFPDGVPSNIEGRNEVIDSWPDDEEESAIDLLLEEVDAILMPCMGDLETRLERHLERCGLIT